MDKSLGNDILFENKNVLITGGTGGIGSQVVKQLIKGNAHIWILARSESKVLDLYSYSFTQIHSLKRE